MYNVEIIYINDLKKEDITWFQIKNLNDLNDLLQIWLSDKDTKSIWIRYQY